MGNNSLDPIWEKLNNYSALVLGWVVSLLRLIYLVLYFGKITVHPNDPFIYCGAGQTGREVMNLIASKVPDTYIEFLQGSSLPYHHIVYTYFDTYRNFTLGNDDHCRSYRGTLP